jgi:hypothetical protein
LLHFYQKGEDFVVIPIDEGCLVLGDRFDIGLKGFDHFGEEPVVGREIAFQLLVYGFEVVAVFGFGFPFHAHDGANGVD